MKKRQIVEGIVTKREFPNKGILEDCIVKDAESGEIKKEHAKCVIKNTLPGQNVRGMINKVRHGNMEARLLEVIDEAPNYVESICPHFGICGSCHYLSMSYEDENKLKEEQVLKLLGDAFSKQKDEVIWDGIRISPIRYEYRNKMEFSFGDSIKDGPLALGMHKRGSMYDIVTTNKCAIIDEDYRKILSCVLDYFAPMYDTDDIGKEKVTFYHKMKQEGYLRHLLVRKAKKTGQILVDLVTTTKEMHDLMPLKERLLGLNLDGKIVGFLHTKNDSLSDAVIDEGTEILYGQATFEEELLGLKFEITPFSFFQTNSLSAEVLYDIVRDYVRCGMKESGRDKAHILYDLYCGTGTISQLMADVSDKVYGVEIVEEAVEAAKENARRNNIDNCTFIAGDVLKELDGIEEKPDYIILDPPRDGVHPKALDKIINYGVDHMVYVSCKPTSLARDLEKLIDGGYKIERACAVNQFPATVHVETVVLLSKV